MQIIYKRLTDIKQYGNNPRLNDNAVYAVANSIKEFGFKAPIIVDNSGTIIAGHTRFKAAKRLNMVEVPCVIADDLTPEQVKAFRIADNSTAELALWDDDILRLELDGLDFDFTDFGLFLDDIADDENKTKEEKESAIQKMELRAFEHYDYIVFVFDNQHDFMNAASEFGLKRVDAGYSNRKIGIGRVLKGAELVKRLGNKSTDNLTESLRNDNNT